MTEAATLKRLRLPYFPAYDESVCGAVAAACHAQRLRSIISGLEGGGIRLSRPGSIQIAEPSIINAVARIMHVEPSTLHDLAFRVGQVRGTVHLGDLLLPRRMLDWNRRRIGPQSLSITPYHRSSWLNLALPYCLESLELLVDRCPTCGPLGWRHTRGIANCDCCGLAIAPSAEPPLSPHLVEPYRAFGDLLSRHSAAGDRAMALLPASLRTYSRSTVANLAVRAGLVFSDHGSQRGIGNLVVGEPAKIAEAMCTGMSFLMNWPTGIREQAKRRATGLMDDVKSFEEFVQNVRWIGADTLSDSGPLLRVAFPRFDCRNADMFTDEVRFYTAAETNLLLSRSSSQLSKLRQLEAIRYEQLPARSRTIARYNADDVDALRAIIRSGTSPNSAAARLDLPIYAVGQLAAISALRIQVGEVIKALRDRNQVELGSVDALGKALVAKAAPGQIPSGLISVRRALAQYPGEKHYARLIAAMLDGRLRFYLDQGKFSIRRALVSKADTSRLLSPGFRSMPDPLGIGHVTLGDACEILGAQYDEGVAAMRSSGLAAITKGKGKAVDRSELSKLVSEIAFLGEAFARTGTSPTTLHHQFLRAGFRAFTGLGAGELYRNWAWLTHTHDRWAAILSIRNRGHPDR